jgi:dihydroorotase
MSEITVKMLFDRHVHLRQGDLMNIAVPDTVRQCSGAIVMPNTKPVINKINLAREYRGEIDILSHKEGVRFSPYLTYYLTDNTEIEELERGYREGIWIACKLYPLGATTNSARGVSNIENIYPVFKKMQDIGMPLLIHCEERDSTINFFDRERAFVKNTMPTILREFPDLKIVVEHVSTKEAVDFVIQHENVWGTVTPHHLMKNCNAMFENGFDPTYFCYPILNSEDDRLAIVNAVTSQNKEIRGNFGAGTDSAIHYLENKLKVGGDGGICIARVATEAYTQIFVENNAKLAHLNDFLAVNLLEEVYGISPTRDLFTTLVNEEWEVLKDSKVLPFMAGETLQWRIKSQTER